MKANHPQPSWPGLTRPSKRAALTFRAPATFTLKDVLGGVKPGHDDGVVALRANR
jgi:hypothetical protein